MTVFIALSVLVAIVGLLMYFLAANPKVEEVGRIMLFSGLLAFLLRQVVPERFQVADLAFHRVRLVALVVDAVAGVCELTDRQMVSVKRSLPFAEYLKGVAKLEDDLALIYDLDQFLSLDEENVLDAALAGGRA